MLYETCAREWNECLPVVSLREAVQILVNLKTTPMPQNNYYLSKIEQNVGF